LGAPSSGEVFAVLFLGGEDHYLDVGDFVFLDVFFVEHPFEKFLVDGFFEGFGDYGGVFHVETDVCFACFG